MKKYSKFMASLIALFAIATGAMATPIYYTILHALEEETMDVFTAGGSGSLSVSKDGGDSFETISEFKFDRRGRAVARVAYLNRVPADSPVKLVASFNESEEGQPVDTIVETTAAEFLDSLNPYDRWPWLAYAPVYVSYENLPTIVDIAVSDGRFTNLVAAVIQEGLAGALSEEGSYTVFAPTDAAFEALGATGDALLAIPDLRQILEYHVLPAVLDGDAVAAATHLETLLGKTVDVTVDEEGRLFINDSQVIIPNLKASNGIVHVIDAVLIPTNLPNIVEIASGDDRFETLVAALVETGLDGLLTNEGPFTVFAPTDEAFEVLASALEVEGVDLLSLTNLADVLAYHVVDGRFTAEDVIAVERLTTLLGEDVKIDVTDAGVFINDSLIIQTDIKAENGIIHVIDAVLIPEEMPDIVDVAIGAGNFTTLVGALTDTGLDEVLRTDGPFTVFAPTDEAFEKLPKWLLKFLVNNPKYLSQVLLYHVAPGDLSASEVLAQGKIGTVQGRSVKAKVKGGDVFINNSKVIGADIEAENGTVHVIDRVLIPWFRY